MSKPKKKSPPPPSAKTGPKPDTLKLSGKCQDAVEKSLSKNKPAEGWPK